MQSILQLKSQHLAHCDFANVRAPYEFTLIGVPKYCIIYPHIQWFEEGTFAMKWRLQVRLAKAQIQIYLRCTNYKFVQTIFNKLIWVKNGSKLQLDNASREACMSELSIQTNIMTMLGFLSQVNAVIIACTIQARKCRDELLGLTTWLDKMQCICITSIYCRHLKCLTLSKCSWQHRQAFQGTELIWFLDVWWWNSGSSFCHRTLLFN